MSDTFEVKLPRGIRNKNPGNIERSDKFTWQGEKLVGKGEHDYDYRFAVFENPVYGLRAMMKLLINYNQKHNIRTLRGAIERYAPSFENKTDAYVKFVSQQADINPDTDWDFTQRMFLIPVVKAMVRFENGAPPQEQVISGATVLQWYTDKTYEDAYELAKRGRITSHTFNEVLPKREEKEKVETKPSIFDIIWNWIKGVL